MNDTVYIPPSAGAPPTRPLAELAAHADAVLQRLRAGRARILSGQPTELGGFEVQVAQLCRRSLCLDPQEGRLFRQHLLAVRAELDATLSLLAAGQAHRTMADHAAP